VSRPHRFRLGGCRRKHPIGQHKAHSPARPKFSFVRCACRTVSPYPRKVTVRSATPQPSQTSAVTWTEKRETETKAFPSLFARFRFRNYADSLYEIGIVNTQLTEGLNFHWLATRRVTE
jgi:hypothetical protein